MHVELAESLALVLAALLDLCDLAVELGLLREQQFDLLQQRLLVCLQNSLILGESNLRKY